ncbi:MAG TPA: SMC-Scp complex subunit ScpB [Gemmataceae bacterium]|nr:SMC-Scp complex subunit ScpB [Gemmataceae bacterium]
MAKHLPRDRRPPALHRLFLDTFPGGVWEREEAGVGRLARDARLALVEAALLAADEPLTLRRLAAAAGVADHSEVRQLVRRLQDLYDQDGTAFQVEELAGGFQLLTRTEYHPWLARWRRAGNELRLSAAARETLAIVAYRQPITRADVEAIRGVQSADMLHQLMEKGLVRISGRDESLGRPVLYGTARKFLQAFGLRSIRDLPQAEELIDPARKRGRTKPNEPEA